MRAGRQKKIRQNVDRHEYQVERNCFLIMTSVEQYFCDHGNFLSLYYLLLFSLVKYRH